MESSRNEEQRMMPPLYVKWHETADEVHGIARLITKYMLENDLTYGAVAVAIPYRAYEQHLKEALHAVAPRGKRRTEIPDGPNQVHIGNLGEIAALANEVRLAVVVSTVEGLFPPLSASEDNAALQMRLNAYREALTRLKDANIEQLVFSGFQMMNAARAKAAHIPYRRAREENGQQFAMMKRSPLIAEVLGDDLLIVSGEQYLGER